MRGRLSSVVYRIAIFVAARELQKPGNVDRQRKSLFHKTRPTLKVRRWELRWEYYIKANNLTL